MSKKKPKNEESGSGVEDSDVTSDPGVAVSATAIGGKKELAVGDEVMVPCRVTAIHPRGEGDKYTNVTLETLEVMFPQGRPIQLTVNAAMVSK